jgi:hypothetical protein
MIHHEATKDTKDAKNSRDVWVCTPPSRLSFVPFVSFVSFLFTGRTMSAKHPETQPNIGDPSE